MSVTRNSLQKRGAATSWWAEDHEHLSRLQYTIDPFENLDFPFAMSQFVENLADQVWYDVANCRLVVCGQNKSPAFNEP